MTVATHKLPNLVTMGAVLSTTLSDLPVKKVLHERHLCPHCRRVSPIVQDIHVTDRNGWVYVGFSDGDTLLVTTSRSCDCCRDAVSTNAAQTS